MRNGYVVQVIPPERPSVLGYSLRRRYVVAAVALMLALVGGLFALQMHRLAVASADLRRLRAERAEQQRKLDAMERQAQALQKQNLESERSIERIERALGERKTGMARRPALRATLGDGAHGDAVLAARLATLARASAQTHAQANRLAGLASRILVLRRLSEIARERMIAEIPSLNPVNGGINAGFGWRTDPFPEFHKGLDLAADYGTLVHAAAAGTVASAGWAGEFGIKVDIDHGNGYHTWYCHLSRIAVGAGQHVLRGDTIGAVGSTGESTGPHLHYQVMRDGVAIDPQPFLAGVPHDVMATLPQISRVP